MPERGENIATLYLAIKKRWGLITVADFCAVMGKVRAIVAPRDIELDETSLIQEDRCVYNIPLEESGFVQLILLTTTPKVVFLHAQGEVVHVLRRDAQQLCLNWFFVVEEGIENYLEEE